MDFKNVFKEKTVKKVSIGCTRPKKEMCTTLLSNIFVATTMSYHEIAIENKVVYLNNCEGRKKEQGDKLVTGKEVCSFRLCRRTFANVPK